MVKAQLYNMLLFIKNYRLRRFQIAQMIFILAITFGPFFSDTVRKILFFIALFCIKPAQIRDMLSDWKSKENIIKKYLILMFVFWIYVTIIPVFCGVDPLTERLKSIGYPLEIMFWICGTIIFARDVFFIRCLALCSIGASTIYSLIAWPHLISTNFILNHSYYYAWPLSLASWSVGSILVCLFTWLMYAVYQNEGVCLGWSWLDIALLLLVGSVIILTLYATFWLVGFVQLLVAVFVVYIFNKEYLMGFCKKIFAVILCALILLCVSINVFHGIKTAIYSQVSQITAMDQDIKKFTNSRNLVWGEAVNAIMKRPWVGYGWAEYEHYNKRAMDHTHSSFLQIAWTAGVFPVILFICLLSTAFYICWRELKISEGKATLPFVLLLVLVAFIVNGCLDNLFDATRRVQTLYWVYLSLPECAAFSENMDE